MEATRTLPSLTAGPVRRNSVVATLGLEAFILFACFGGFVAAAPRSDVPAWVRAAIPTSVALIGLFLRDAYWGRGPWSAGRAFVDVVTVIVSVVLSQLVLVALTPATGLNPAWRVPPLWAYAGTPLALLMLFILRVRLGVDGEARLSSAGGRISASELVSGYGHFADQIRLRNRIEVVCVLVIMGLSTYFDLHAPPVVAAIGFTWIGGSLLLVGYIATRCSARPMPANVDFVSARTHYGDELQRQRHLLRSVWWWYFVPLFAGLATNLIVPGIAARQPLRGALGVVAFGSLAYFIATLNRDRRQGLQEKIDALLAMHELTPSAGAPADSRKDH